MPQYEIERCKELKYEKKMTKARKSHKCEEHEVWIFRGIRYEHHFRLVESEQGRKYPPWRACVCLYCVDDWKVLLAAERASYVEKSEYIGTLGKRIYQAYEAGLFRKEIEWQMFRRWFPEKAAQDARFFLAGDTIDPRDFLKPEEESPLEPESEMIDPRTFLELHQAA